MLRLLFALPLLISVEPALCQSTSGDPDTAKAVLITGASSGIGRKITERLAADGYFVYAGARKDKDLESLGSIRNVRPLRLDVTNTHDIDAARDTISKDRHGLYGLVNNAGVITTGLVGDTNWEEFDLVMSVNVYGPYRLTRAFEPLIAAQKGRIIIIGSISGVLANPRLSAYSMSKHAMEAFADSLAQELIEFGVRVSIIEPGDYKSDIFANASSRSGGGSKSVDRTQLTEPDDVADAVERALFAAHPNHRYMVVPNQHEAEITIRKQMEQLVQLNYGQKYSYDRNALVKMLDEAVLENERPNK